MLYLVTVATHSSGYFEALKVGSKKNNFQLVVLGWDQPWKGLSYKFESIKKYLKTLNDDDIVIFVDAFDVIPIERKEIVLEKFKKFNTKILFSKDQTINNYNPLSIIRNLTFGNCDDLYTVTNSGSYMGYVKYLKILFDKIEIKDIKGSDQKLLNTFCQQNKYFLDKYIKIDYDGEIFFNAGCISWIDTMTSPLFNGTSCYIGLEDDLINPKTGKMPSFIHGVGRINLDRYCNILNYPTSTPYKESMSKWLSENDRGVRGAKKYKNIFYFIIFLIIVMLLIIKNKKKYKYIDEDRYNR